MKETALNLKPLYQSFWALKSNFFFNIIFTDFFFTNFFYKFLFKQVSHNNINFVLFNSIDSYFLINIKKKYTRLDFSKTLSYKQVYKLLFDQNIYTNIDLNPLFFSVSKNMLLANCEDELGADDNDINTTFSLVSLKGKLKLFKKNFFLNFKKNFFFKYINKSFYTFFFKNYINKSTNQIFKYNNLLLINLLKEVTPFFNKFLLNFFVKKNLILLNFKNISNLLSIVRHGDFLCFHFNNYFCTALQRLSKNHNKYLMRLKMRSSIYFITKPSSNSSARQNKYKDIEKFISLDKTINKSIEFDYLSLSLFVILDYTYNISHFFRLNKTLVNPYYYRLFQFY